MNPKEWVDSVPIEVEPEEALPFVRATRLLDSVIRLVNAARRGEPTRELCEKIVCESAYLAVMSSSTALPRQRPVTVPGKFVTLKAKYGEMTQLLSIDAQFTHAADNMNVLTDYIEAERPWVEVRDQTKEVILFLLLMLASLERKRETPPEAPRPSESAE